MIRAIALSLSIAVLGIFIAPAPTDAQVADRTCTYTKPTCAAVLSAAAQNQMTTANLGSGNCRFGLTISVPANEAGCSSWDARTTVVLACTTPANTAALSLCAQWKADQGFPP